MERRAGRDGIFQIFSHPFTLATQPGLVHSTHKNTEGAPRLAFQSLGLGVEVAFDPRWPHSFRRKARLFPICFPVPATTCVAERHQAARTAKPVHGPSCLMT